MRFTNGYWLDLPGVEPLRPRHVETVEVGDDALVAYAATAPLTERRHSLNLPQLTIRVDSPMDGVIGVRINHFQGALDPGPAFELSRTPDPVVVKAAEEAGGFASIAAGRLSARIRTDAPWQLEFVADEKVLTSSVERGLAALQTPSGPYVHEQLSLGVGEHVYGLGERFGAVRQERPDRRHLERRRRHRAASRPTRTSRSTSPAAATASSSTTPSRCRSRSATRGRSRASSSRVDGRDARATTSSTARRRRTSCAATPR